MVQKKDTALLANAFATVAHNNKYWNQWFVADVWATLINKKLQLQDDMKVTGSNLSLNLFRTTKYKSVKDVVDIYHTPNVFGLFRSKISKVTAFYVTSITSCPKLNHHMPGGSTQFLATIPDSTSATTNNTTTTDLPSTTVSTPPPPPVEAGDAEQHERRPRKKARRWMSLPAAEQESKQQRARFSDGQFGSTSNLRKRKKERNKTTTEPDTPPESDTPAPPARPTNVAALEIQNQDYFDSPEANHLFGRIQQETTAEDEVSVRTTIHNRIQKLTEAFSTPAGWKCILEDRDSKQTCSAFQIYNIQIKCRYIAIALRIALQKMGRGAGGATWLDCCQEAMNTVNQFNNITYIKFHRTIQGWHLLYRRNGECFPNPNTHKKDGKKTLPRLLEENPDLKDAIIYYSREHLHELSASLLYHYLHEEALPAPVEKKKKELDNHEYTKDDLLAEHQLKKLTLTTVYKWMERLGFRYQPRKKCYYVDGHEKPEVIVYRQNFICRYFEHEKRMCRWIQIPLSEVESMEEVGELEKGMGKRYSHRRCNRTARTYH